jgi:hypothetical protein
MSSTETTHHISDIDTWGGADRSYFTFVIISVLFGFFGLDHFYLRSFGTGTQKFFVNLFTFGMWYVWDVLQIATDGEQIRKNGLSSPLDWIRGIGRGVFIPPGVDPRGAPAAPKSYLLYAFLAICFGFLGADKFYMGRGWEGLAKLLSCFNIFLFLFGWIWVLWDSFHVFFMTGSILKDGISPPMPYSFFFTEPIPGKEFLMTPGGDQAQTVCNEGAIWCTMDWIAKTFGFPMPPKGLPLGTIYKDLVAPVLSVPVVKAIQELKESPRPAVPAMPAMPAAPAMPGMPSRPEAPKMPGMPSLPEAPKMPALPEAPKAPMAGGGQSSHASQGPGPVIAGSLTALVIAGGLKGFYDFISKQYG